VSLLRPLLFSSLAACQSRIANDSRADHSRARIIADTARDGRSGGAASAFLPPVLLVYVWHVNLAVTGIRRRFHQLRLARLAVPHQHRHGDPSRRTTAAASLDPLARRPLRLVPVILEPDLHLGRCEPYDGRQMFALGRAQVTLLAEAPLQLVRLRLGEQHAPLALLVLGLVGLRRLVAGLLLVLKVL